MTTNYNASVLVSLFKRKGGEGVHTRIIYNINDNISSIPVALNEEESGLFVYYLNESEWLMLTAKRILACVANKSISIYNDDIMDVNPAFQEEFSIGVKDSRLYKRLIVKDRSGFKHTVKFESGEPYAGLLQVLYFIAKKT